MAVVALEILSREPYEGGRSWGGVGAYERIEAVATYSVDPLGVGDSSIVDLDLAPRGADGRVTFTGDVSMLIPTDPARANGTVLLDVPNRGRRIAVSTFNRAQTPPTPTAEIHPGDGYLFREGWSVVWCGWQWDVPRSPARMGLDAPRAVDGHGGVPTGDMQLRFQPHHARADVLLTDQHVSGLATHQPISPADIDDLEARLTVSDGLDGEPTLIPRASWRFARVDEGGAVVPADDHVWLEGGFEAGRIYDLIYQPREAPVAGTGLLALRDLGLFVRSNVELNPLADHVNQVIVTGQSQCGRLLRMFLELGLNQNEDGTPAFDGVLAHIAGGRRGEFNHRFAQPSVQPMASFGHRFPFADLPQTDPHSGQVAGLLDRTLTHSAPPRVFFTDTAAEYWRGDASLAHTDAATGADVALADNVRRYLFSSTQHGAGFLPFTDEAIFGSRGANLFNIVDYTPLLRAALANLRAWIVEGVEPPPSRIPTSADGTAVERAEVLEVLGTIPGMNLPDPSQLVSVAPLDLGTDADEGVGTFPAKVVGPRYPTRVSAVDETGNDRAGVVSPDVSEPVATHTGFNPRHPTTGGPGQLLDYLGSTMPLAVTAAERLAAGDPRLSLEERYGDLATYQQRVREAAEGLVADRYLLAEDIERCVRIASRRYEAVVENAAAPIGV